MEDITRLFCEEPEEKPANWISRWITKGMEICRDNVLPFAPHTTKKVCMDFFNICNFTYIIELYRNVITVFMITAKVYLLSVY